MEANAIAVIGMSGRFPGASDLRAFWKNLSSGVESVRYLSDDELRAAGESVTALADPAYVKACACLDGIEMFDAAFFGWSPRDAAIVDPQHRLFLECAWEAFERAGYVGEGVTGPVGVFAACGMNEYMVKNVMTHPEVVTSLGEWLVRHTGNDTNFLATRVSYELDLRGPSMNVQTACSSTLVAIHLACQSLLGGECDIALAGGATIYAEPNRGYFWREGEIFSRDGHTRSFDASASGAIMSNAVGCVVLKRLADAVRDRDTVLAVIRGSAVNNDGRDKVGYLAPSVSGQARAVAEAMAVAGVSAEQVSYVEAHGTATRIGDPIEIAALTQAFRASTDQNGYCAIGSLKSNIGHTGEASGVSAFIKTVLALQNREIPPSLHCESANPRCELDSSPFVVNTRLRPWEASPRIAGINSLGAGGTNCHLIVQEAPPTSEAAPSRGTQLLLVSAKTAAALEAASQNLARHLADETSVALADVAFTLAVGRKRFRHRRAIVARDAEEAIRAIGAMDPRRVFTGSTGEPRPVAFLFPDLDASHRVTGSCPFREEPAFQQAMDGCLALAGPEPSQAAVLFALEYAMGALLRSWKIEPAALVGVGVGEYAAACHAGVLEVRDALALVSARGQSLPSRLPGPRIPLVSSRTGTWLGEAQASDPRTWLEASPCPARVEEGLRALLADGIHVLVQVGPGRSLINLAKRQPEHPSTIATMGSPGEADSDLTDLLAAVGRLWTIADFDASGLYEGQQRRRVPLPTYPWQRQRYWLTHGRARIPEEATKSSREQASQPTFERPELTASFVAPSTPLETELAAIWRELLGIERIGVHDDFFELGGQSLTAVRFFARIRSKYGVDLPIITLLDAPTIEGCVQVLSAALAAGPVEPAVGPGFRSLVEIQPGGTHQPFYCVHGAGGNVLNFRELARALGPEQPFYGLQARGVDGTLRPHVTLEEMASAYFREIQTVQPTGPYMIGGYSGGGLVALEIARLMTDAGHAVNLLALIDTLHPAVPVRKMTLARYVQRILDEGPAYLRQAVGGRMTKRRSKRDLAEIRSLLANGQPIPPDLREIHLIRSFEEAVARYRPRPWKGSAILFRVEQLDYIHRDAPEAYGWDEVISDVTVNRVPGTHANLLLGLEAASLIDALGLAIEGAQGREAHQSPAGRTFADDSEQQAEPAPAP